MRSIKLTNEQLFKFARFTKKDIDQIHQCRRHYNKLGFGYQVVFVRIFNRFPKQNPFEIVDQLLSHTSVQLNIPGKIIEEYSKRQATISEHREIICKYLELNKFKGKKTLTFVNNFIFEAACRLEQTGSLISKTVEFLKENKILLPADDTLRRIVGTQREEARKFVFQKISDLISQEMMEILDSLLHTRESSKSVILLLKQSPGRPSPSAMHRLIKKIEVILETEILELDLSWLNNNFQRALTRYAKCCTATRLRKLEKKHR